MDQQQALNHPNVNAFDIIPDKKSQYGFQVYTHPKKGESEDQYLERDIKNFERALKLKSH